MKTPVFVILSPSASVILSEAKNLVMPQDKLREGSILSSKDEILRGVYLEPKRDPSFHSG